MLSGRAPLRERELGLLWQRDQRRVIVIDGAAKPDATALPDSFYEQLAALAGTAGQKPPPFASTDDFARTLLDDDEAG